MQELFRDPQAKAAQRPEDRAGQQRKDNEHQQTAGVERLDRKIRGEEEIADEIIKLAEEYEKNTGRID